MHNPERHLEHNPIRRLEPPAVGTHDLVCGMAVSNDSQFSTQFEGRTYRFCSQKCQTTFSAEPEYYRISPTETEQVHQVAHRSGNPAYYRTQKTKEGISIERGNRI